jgi:anti-anti-sigma factor
MSQIKIEEQIGGTVLHLKGQFIGGEETDILRDTLKEVTEQKKNRLLINLEKTTFLSSIALGVLISAHTNFVKREGKIVLANVNKSIESIIVRTKISQIFPICGNMDEAIKLISE